MTGGANRRLLAAILALAVLAMPHAARGDPAEEFNDLLKTFNRHVAVGSYTQARQTTEEMRRLAEGPLRDVPQATVTALDSAAQIAWHEGRLGEAESLLKQVLATKQKVFGPDHAKVMDSLGNLAILYWAQGRNAEAQSLHERVLEAKERTLGAEHPEVATSLANLALVEFDRGRFDRAESLFQRALTIREKHLGPDHLDVALNLNNLANVYYTWGRFADAESLHRRALRIREARLTAGHPDFAQSFNNLGTLCHRQNRVAEAESFYRRALATYRKTVGDDHPEVASTLHNLASLYDEHGYPEKAIPLFRESLAIRERNYAGDHPAVAQSLRNLGTLYAKQGRYADAEAHLNRALAIAERKLGQDHPDTACVLHNIGSVLKLQGRNDEAGAVLNRAISIEERTKAFPGLQSLSFWQRAELAWKAKRPVDAVTDLKKAMDRVEWQRTRVAGAELERAGFLSDWSYLFELMVSWQSELGDVGLAFDAIERSRCRSLLDHMDTSGLDLLAGLPRAEARRLQQREQETRARGVNLEKQLRSLERRTDLSAEQRQNLTERWNAETQAARRDFLAAYAEIRNASPAYRLTVTQDRRPLTLPKLQTWIRQADALLLEYLVGIEGGYVLIVPPEGTPRLERLTVTEAQAKSLGIEPGPLTAGRVARVLAGEAGVLKSLRRPQEDVDARPASAPWAALWQVMVPQREREAILARRFKRLVVVPDAGTSGLPFEVLVVASDPSAQYLLDVGPPIVYAPSATVLINLAERPAGLAGAEAVLSVGDCRYSPPSRKEDAMAELRPPARYTKTGGQLKPLPHSEQEITWVAEVFNREGRRATRLPGAWATEANLRANAPGRRILHFACHGLVDQTHGNLFGALALTPGSAPEDPSDDGYLTLGEIYELKLSGCELAILSACETNVGPEQRGEGVWALSRGFLVAGSRRVVASNWLVDDEAAASLVSYFCGAIAQAEKAGGKPDYARCLHEAKRWTRSQEKWRNPYYWGTFVLIGPD